MHARCNITKRTVGAVSLYKVKWKQSLAGTTHASRTGPRVVHASDVRDLGEAAADGLCTRQQGSLPVGRT